MLDSCDPVEQNRAETSTPPKLSRQIVWRELAAGWPALVGASIGAFAVTHGMHFFVSSTVIPFLLSEFHWTRLELSLPPTLVALATAIGAPICGWAVDRFGARAVAVPSLLGAALGLWLISATVSGFWTYLLASLFLACAGAGASLVTYVAIINRSFQRLRGFAIGFTMAASGLTSVIIPPMVMTAAENDGWRASFRLAAWIMLGVAPAVYVFLRLADARYDPAQSTSTGAPETKAAETGMTLGEASRNSQFLRMALAFFLVTFAMSGIFMFFIPALIESGVNGHTAASLIGVMGVAIIFGRLATGLLLDRIFAPFVGCWVFLAGALGCALLAAGPARFGWLSAVLIGLSFGGEIDIAGYVVPRYFGARHSAAIFGWLRGLTVMGGVLSPMFIGFLYDVSGQYLIGFLVAPMLIFIAIVLLATLGRYPETAGSAPMTASLIR